VHKGDFLGQAATGRQVEAVGLCVFRFVDGLISQAWSSFEYSSPQPAARDSYLVRGPVQYLAAMA
jgi:hypothetical protein